MKNEQLEGQMNLFDFLPVETPCKKIEDATVMEHLVIIKALIDDLVNKLNKCMNDKDKDWKKAFDITQQLVYVQVEVNRAIFQKRKTEWHDLTKNGNDNPKESGFYICKFTTWGNDHTYRIWYRNENEWEHYAGTLLGWMGFEKLK